MSFVLPVEMWAEIVRYLPSRQALPLLSVSRIIHDIAIRSVFSTVRLYFMHGQPAFYMLHTESEKYALETSDFLLNRSWELINYIIMNPVFASAVKTLSVHAFTDGPAVFEHRNLAQALLCLPHLQSFHYFGDCPDFSNVAEYLPKDLKHLRIQSMPNPELLGHLDSLKFLQPAILFMYVRDQKQDQIFAVWERGVGDAQDLVSVVESNPVQELVLSSTHVGLLPIRICNRLTRLDICVPQFEQLVGLDLVFHHAQFLESLSLVGYIEPFVFADLPKESDVLPHLRSFRLSCEFWDQEVTEMQVPLLSEFLSRRPSLRRLYLRLPALGSNASMAIATVIGELQNLRVLGFHAGDEPLDESTAFHLAAQLSLQLEALQLTLPWSSDLHVRTWTPLLGKLQQLPRLSFLHLFSNGEDPVPIHPLELATDLEHLELIGLQRSLFTVDRDAGEEWEPKSWSPWLVKYCLPEDFSCADHAWLFRYH